MRKPLIKTLATKETKPTIKSARISKTQAKWFKSYIKKYKTNASIIIIQALHQAYDDFPLS